MSSHMQTHEKTGVSKKKAVLHMSDLAGQTMKVEASTGWARGLVAESMSRLSQLHHSIIMDPSQRVVKCL